MGQKTFSYYLRQCERCDKLYKADTKRSKICKACFKKFGRRLKNVI